jgi:energy-coupling factor transporter ATP-binding protein EcfA2
LSSEKSGEKSVSGVGVGSNSVDNMEPIYQISWVTPENFDPDKVQVQQTTSTSAADTYERSKIMYEYKPGSVKDLVLTVPKNPDAYITCRGVQKDFFSRGEQKIETNRYGSQFVLDGSNEFHLALYSAFEKVIAKVEELTGATVVFPAKDMETYSILYTNLIHANDGRMFSSAYTAEEQLDILSCKQSIVRPAFLLSTFKRSPKEVKIRVQVSQMYVFKEVMNFPLAYKD